MYDAQRATVLFGEYGGIGWANKEHLWEPDRNWGYVQFNSVKEVTDEYVKYAEQLKQLIRQGFSAAVYTQTTDVEVEVNGLLTYDRKLVKVDEDRVRKVNQEICNILSKIIYFCSCFSLSLLVKVRKNQGSEDYFIEWEKNTLICIADEGGYPRLRRLKDNSLLSWCMRTGRGDLMVKKSTDEGITWGEPVMAYEAFNYTDEQTGERTRAIMANPEIIQLDNGDILLASNLRPRDEGVFPFSIALKRSRDNGATWTEADILYRAGTYFRNGCWEPSFLMLPNGTLHLYFANESP